jgi:hypothetical protein
MGADNEQSDFTMSRRRLLTALGLGSGALAAATLNIAPDARAAILADIPRLPRPERRLWRGSIFSSARTLRLRSPSRGTRRSLSPIHASRLAASMGG